jgi:4-hydroxybenzoate polyprenyltransferase
LSILETLRQLYGVSRPEFLPANMGSLVLGLAWGYDPSGGFSLETGIMVILSFAVLTVVSAIGAQLNTLSDYELDSIEPRKDWLVRNLNQLGRGKVRRALLAELALSVLVAAPLMLMRRQPIQLVIFMLALFLTYAYSAPPIRLKARSILAMISLSLVLSALPVTFIYYTFAQEMSPIFLLFLAGQTLTVYSVIIPTETRDYFSDKAMGVKTMTVWLGLSRASLLAMAMLASGAAISMSAFLMTPTLIHEPLIAFSFLAMVAADLYVLRALHHLYRLSKDHEAVEGEAMGAIGEKVVEFSSRNPKWITIVTQAIIFVNVVYLVGKILG